MKKVLLLPTLLVGLIVSLNSCKSDSNSPGYEYMPDMYRSPSFETYGVNEMYPDSMASRLPVKGTIPRGFKPYGYENNNDGYEKAGAELKNPLPYSKETVAEGKAIYDKFCSQCHGKDGQGDGPVATNPAWPGPPPPYNGRLVDLPEGKIFHSITYGKGLMGSHSAQISYEDRWKLTYYVQKLQGKDLEKIHSGLAEAASEEVNNENDNKETASL